MLLSFERYKIDFGVVACLFFLALMPDFSWLGQDAYTGWIPIIKDFLRGDQVFTDSVYHYGGQNLLSIYGYLPIWKIARFFELNPYQTLNLSLAVFILFLYFYLNAFLEVIWNREITSAEKVFLVLFSIFSPLVFNRIYPGHINLLFGLLPSFVIQLGLMRYRKRDLVIGVLALWHAFSVQGYQVIIYNLFFIPFYIFSIKQYRPSPKKLMIYFGVTFLGGFLLSLNAFTAMFEYALSSQNIRKSGVNVVYSYMSSQLVDLLNLFIADRTPLNSQRSVGYFHELNYPFFLFLIAFAFIKEHRKMALNMALVVLLILLFVYGVPPLSLLGDVPILGSFRIPHRALIFPGIIFPFFILATIVKKIEVEEVAVLSAFLVLSLFLPYSEFFFFFFVMGLIIYLKMINYSELMRVVILGLMLCHLAISNFKIGEIHKSYLRYSWAETRLKNTFKYKEDRKHKYTFHIEGDDLVYLNAAAKVLGIKTLEGKGMPPKNLLDKYAEVIGKKFNPNTTHFYFGGIEGEKKKEILKSFGVDYILKVKVPTEPDPKGLDPKGQ